MGIMKSNLKAGNTITVTLPSYYPSETFTVTKVAKDRSWFYAYTVTRAGDRLRSERFELQLDGTYLSRSDGITSYTP